MKPQIILYLIITTILSILFIKDSIDEYKLENGLVYLNCSFTKGNIFSWKSEERINAESWKDTLEISDKHNSIKSLMGTKFEQYDLSKNSIKVKNQNHLNISQEEYYIDRITGNLKGTLIKDGKIEVFHGQCIPIKRIKR